MLRATFLTSILFLGKKRTPSEIIEWDELNTALESGRTTRQALDALHKQKMILLQGDGIEPEAAERIKGVEDRLVAIEEGLARIEAQLKQALEGDAEAVTRKRRMNER